MEKYLEDIKESHFLRDSSKNLYISKLNTLKKYMDKDLTYIIHHPDIVHKALIDKGLTAPTIVSYISSIIALFIYSRDNLKEELHDLFKEWNDIKKRISIPINERYINNEPTTKQQEAYYSYDYLQKIKSSLPYGQDRLLFTLYLDIIPIRADYWNAYISDNLNDKTGNYIYYNKDDRKNSKIILNNYKTSNKYGTLEIPLDQKVLNDIISNVNARNNDMGIYDEHLFLTSYGKPFYTRQSFTTWANTTLKDIIKAPTFSLSMFRHIYLSRPELKFKDKSLKELSDLGRLMGHSSTMGRMYSWKTDPKN
jgi:integrase